MFQEIPNSFNWIDILMGCILVRCLYAGVVKGLVVEVFKLMGMLFATVLTLHYYSQLSHMMVKSLKVPPFITSVTSFLFIWFLIAVIFKIFRDGLLVILKTDMPPFLLRTGGCVLGGFRAILASSLTFALIFVIGNDYLIKTARQSATGHYLIDIAPRIYHKTFDGFIGKLFPNEEKNKSIAEIAFKESTGTEPNNQSDENGEITENGAHPE